MPKQKGLTQRQQMALWMRERWENLLKYLVFNNPQEVIQVLSDDCGLPEAEMTEEELYTAALTCANDSGDPEAFTKQLSDIIPHNNENPGWANLLNYDHA